MNYENKELWNTDMQVGKPYKATILKNYHILLYVHKSYSIVTFVDALYHLENNFIYWLKSIYAVIILRLSKYLKTFYVYIFFKLQIYWNSNQWWMRYFSLCRHSHRSLVYGRSEWKTTWYRLHVIDICGNQFQSVQFIRPFVVKWWLVDDWCLVYYFYIILVFNGHVFISNLFLKSYIK